MAQIEQDMQQDDVALADRMKLGRQRIIEELKKLIIGQDEVVNQVLLTLFVGGNSLIVGVPGLAKTLLIHSMARVLDLKFNRIQFTPDLMPSDITGTDIINEDPATGRRQMQFAPGPIFANIVLADVRDQLVAPQAVGDVVIPEPLRLRIEPGDTLLAADPQPAAGILENTHEIVARQTVCFRVARDCFILRVESI